MKLERISPSAAKDAIYLDFEGEGPIGGEIPRPALAGTEINKSYVFWILDHRLELLAKARRDLPWVRQVTDLESFLSWITTTALLQGRRIVYFSEHEEKVISRHMDSQTYDRFSQVSYNGKLLIQRWHRKKTGHRMEEASLDSFATYAGLKKALPPAEGVGNVIRRLRIACDGKNRLSKLRVQDRDRWVSLINYNRNDCFLTRRLVRRAAAYLHTP